MSIFIVIMVSIIVIIVIVIITIIITIIIIIIINPLEQGRREGSASRQDSLGGPRERSASAGRRMGTCPSRAPKPPAPPPQASAARWARIVRHVCRHRRLQRL